MRKKQKRKSKKQNQRAYSRFISKVKWWKKNGSYKAASHRRTCGKV